MKTDIMFIDQTLGNALESHHIDIVSAGRVKAGLEALVPMVFDMTLAVYAAIRRECQINMDNIRASVRPVAEEIDEAFSLGCRMLKINMNYQEIKQVPEPVKAALQQAQLRGVTVALAMAGGCRCSLSGLYALARIVRLHNITRLVVDDKIGELDPMVTYRTLRSIKQGIPCELEYHGNNDWGLATGNALSAIRSGVRCIAVSCGGVYGYPALEEVLMGARYLLELPLSVPEKLANDCATILQELGQCVRTTKAIIGTDIFAHESGIHVDGVNKKSDLYEPFTPETVGLSRKIVLGKHSGKAALELKCRELSLSVNPANMPVILERVRVLAVGQKAPVADWQLRQLVSELAS